LAEKQKAHVMAQDRESERSIQDPAPRTEWIATPRAPASSSRNCRKKQRYRPPGIRNYCSI